jgi:signal transduction histidine kinase
LPTSETLAALQTLANQAAIALDNARLFAAEQEHAQALAEVGTMRDDFIATVAHELRTPLTVVRGYAATLRAFGRTMAPERYESVVTRLDAAAERLTRLADDLVLVTAIERQGMEVQSETVELDAIARAVAEDLAGVYPGLRIVVRGRPGILVRADRLRLHQVLANLADNAARYSPPDAVVEVQWRQAGSGVTLAVRDHGPGVPPEFRGRLFSRFGTTGRALRGRRPGTGLGLYLAQELLGLMGGTITYRDAPGGGAIFQVRLPRADSSQ